MKKRRVVVLDTNCLIQSISRNDTELTCMEIMAIFFSICAVIVGAFWAYTESHKGKEWIKNL